MEERRELLADVGCAHTVEVNGCVQDFRRFGMSRTYASFYDTVLCLFVDHFREADFSLLSSVGALRLVTRR